VQPLTRYNLLFDVAVGVDETSAWVLQTFADEGLLPFEGVFDADWQRIVPQRSRYSHQFRTPRDGTRLRLLLTHDGPAPRLDAITLEPLANANPVVNGDFSAGLGNYSGWNTRHLAHLDTNAQGAVVLRCVPMGYAVTDPIPVEPGATYRYMPGSTEGRVLVCDRGLLRTDWIEDYDARRTPVLKMPPDAAFIRIVYCDGRAGRAPVIRQVGIERVEPGPATEMPIFPPYPGEIVLDPHTAREIQHWTRRISGQEMRVLAEAGPEPRTKIFVGRAWAEPLFPGDLKAMRSNKRESARHETGGNRKKAAFIGVFAVFAGV
jgi:hypothetical protein